MIACGGTGGHLFPGIAVAEELRSRGHDALLLISEKQVDREGAQKYAGLRFQAVDPSGCRTMSIGNRLATAPIHSI